MNTLCKRAYLMSLLFSSAVLATINTRIEPSTLSLGESFRLIITQENNPAAHEPDLMPLQTDFEIQASANTQSTTLINGHLSQHSEWILTLQPKKIGTLTIPSLQIGAERSNPTQVTVTATPNRPAVSQSNQLITTVSNKTPFMNQQIRYTVKLIHRDPLLDSDYQPPQLEDALVIPLGQGKHYQTTQNGESVQVEEQDYALFPQKSGKQVIQAPQLHGAVLQFGMPQRLELRAPSSTLHVKPMPKHTKRRSWFPAQAVALTERYDQTKKTLMEGSTLRRTITLTAMGEPAELFPAIEAKTSQGASVYPEKPQLRNRLSGSDIVGEKTLSISYVLNQPGQITLPAYRITWFDLSSNDYKTVTLPERKLQVTAHKKTAATKPSHQSTIAARPNRATNTSLAWIMAIAFAVLWLLTLSYLCWQQWIVKCCSKLTSLTKKHNSLYHELLSNDPRRAEQAVLRWARQQWPKQDIHHLDGVRQLIDDESIQAELSELIKQRYGRERQTNWQGKNLWKKLKMVRPRRVNRKTPRQPLPPINP